jgi:hypothetical protein
MTSSTPTMLGWDSDASARPSRSSLRATSGPVACSTFSATASPLTSSVAA